MIQLYNSVINSITKLVVIVNIILTRYILTSFLSLTFYKFSGNAKLLLQVVFSHMRVLLSLSHKKELFYEKGKEYLLWDFCQW